METAVNRRRASDDPRRLRELLDRAQGLAVDHQVPSVVIGLAGREGDLVFPDLVSFVQSALRMEDAVFRMTRERAVLVLSDATPERAENIVERLLADFQSQFPASRAREIAVRYYPVPPGTPSVSVRDVLPAVFSDGSDSDPN